MTFERTRRRSLSPTPPPKLDRVQPGYTPPPIRHGLTPVPLSSAALQTVNVTAEMAVRGGVHHRGDLARDSALRLVLLVAARKASGRLRIRAGGLEVAVVFRGGVPEHARSTEPSDDLVRYLLERGVIDPAALADAGGADDADHELVCELLSRRDPTEASRLVQEHGTRLIVRALRWERGDWEWEPHAGSPALGSPLGDPLALVSVALRGMDEETLRRRLGERGEHRTKLVDGAIELEELGLQAHELAAAATLFDGATSPLEAASAAATDRATVLRAALLLLEAGLLAAAP